MTGVERTFGSLFFCSYYVKIMLKKIYKLPINFMNNHSYYLQKCFKLDTLED